VEITCDWKIQDNIVNNEDPYRKNMDIVLVKRDIHVFLIN